jgi:hypothetical protein
LVHAKSTIEMADDELTTETESHSGSGEASPEPFFGAGGGKPHEASALFEDASLIGGHKRTTEHEGLRVPARIRAERSPTRSFRDAPERGPSPSRHLRGTEGARQRSSARIRAGTRA